MTDLSIALVELLRKYQDDPQLDALREGVRLMAEALMDREVTQQVGAGRYERSAYLKTHRNGYRERTWDTRIGTIALRIPELRECSYFPSLLELVAGRKRRCFPWSRRPTWKGGVPGKSMRWSKPWGWKGSARARCLACARNSTKR